VEAQHRRHHVHDVVLVVDDQDLRLTTHRASSHHRRM
jgi:hypothetical protein